MEPEIRKGEKDIIRILIADEQVILTESLSMIFSKEQDMEVVATAKSGFDVVCKCRELIPDVVIIDAQMPGISGIKAAAIIKKSYPRVKVAILASSEEDRYVAEALENGADAYALKDIKPGELIQLVKSIYKGYRVIGGASGTRLSLELNRHSNVSEGSSKTALKEEEIIIIRLILEGRSNKVIAGYLECAEGTVKNKVTKIMEAVGVRTRAQLVTVAIRNGLV